ncbi:lysophospholipid acyltransferase family protein [Nannocystis pusilla]|uniref:Lysophospholipid acyltransferase family protein n=1 Tax=Nannocystis pusilla TaxID=889268 RepID=A0A9X3ER37_9BACT|nr:lysophospholipid acyltransferase family protein [Nannocystis pusilla]MCY1005196.1 lysophospholipid acyltransferase family protein [Nannocystis pusilla]
MVFKILKKAAQVVYSAAVWTASFAWMGAVAVTWAAVSTVVPSRKTHNYIGGPGMGAVLKITLSKVEIIYDPDFDPERRGVFMMNHVNLLDAHAACASIPHAFCGLMNAWQFKIPMYGWIMKLADGIPVPDGKNRYRAIAEAARDRAKKGISILAFPEAHRTLDGKVAEFKRGVFWMARIAGLPVIPLATHGMYDLMQKGSYLLTPTKITIYVGAPIETKGLSDAELAEVMERAHKIIADFAERGIVPGRAAPIPSDATPIASGA